MLIGRFCRKEYTTSHAILIFNSILAKIKDISNCLKHLMNSEFYFLPLGKYMVSFSDVVGTGNVKPTS